MSTNDTTETDAQLPESYDDSTVDAVRESLDTNDYTIDELEAILATESKRDDPRSTALEAIDTAINDARDDGQGEPADSDVATPDEEAVAETMDESEHAIGEQVVIRPAQGDPYVAGEWFDDGNGERAVAYNRRVAEAIESGKAEIVE